MVAAIYARVAVLEAVLRARLLIEPAAAAVPRTEAADEWITAEEVTKRFSLDPPWIKRHRRLLRARKILTTPSRKKSLYHARRMAAFLDAQASR